MDTDILATVYFLNEDNAEQNFSDYDELLGFLTERGNELDYIKWY